MPTRDCWVALPGPVVNQLLAAQAPMPTVLRLKPLAPSGEPPAHGEAHCQLRNDKLP